MSEKTNCREFAKDPAVELTEWTACLNCGQHWMNHSEDTQQAWYDAHTFPTKPLIDTGSQNVRGYKQQTAEHLALVNEVKAIEEWFGEWLRETYFAAGVKLDPRQVASARTHLEYAFYHLNRAVFQPADPIGDAVKEGPNRG